MAIPTLQAILNQVALLIGGTQSTDPQSPYFFSGVRAGDGTGLVGVNGAYSIPSETLDCEPPVALMFPNSFTAMGPAHHGQLMQGNEDNEDLIHIWLLVWRGDLPTEYALMVAFRDAVPALFRGHMQLSGMSPAPNVDAFIIDGRTGTMHWGGQDYMGWEFVLRVRQLYSVTYTP